MANNQYVNKVSYVENGTSRVLIDISSDTITASALMQGYTAHDASGAPITGTATGGSMVIRDEADSHGGTVRHITAGTVVTGTTSITENGSYDVAQYADAVVNVPAPAPSLQSKTATPTESQQTVTSDQGYDGLSSVTVGAISSAYVGSGVARRTSSDLTASGATVTVPAGYYSAQASKAVASGTAGTPTATKGTVSNHSISVTPSVTNTAGYIAGGTSNGTAVTVSASELVSGSQTIMENGTVDVTNLASVEVSVAGASSTRTATISRSDGKSIPRVQVNGTGTTYSANEAQFTWEDGDTLRFYYGASTYFGKTYVNGVGIHSSAAGGYYMYTPPKCDIDIQFLRNTSREESYVYITYPYLEITSDGAYDVSDYCGVVTATGSGASTGTFTLAADATTETTITNISTIGFIPTKFIFFPDSAIEVENAINALVFQNIGGLYFKLRVISSGQNDTLVGDLAFTSWTSSRSGHLYLNNNNIQIVATSSCILKAGSYTWWAIQ